MTVARYKRMSTTIPTAAGPMGLVLSNVNFYNDTEQVESTTENGTGRTAQKSIWLIVAINVVRRRYPRLAQCRCVVGCRELSNICSKISGSPFALYSPTSCGLGTLTK